MDWDFLLKALDGSLSGILVFTVGWALFTGRLYLRREVDHYRERLVLSDEQTKKENVLRVAAEHMVYDLTNELREHNKTNDKVIDVLLSKKGTDNGSTYKAQ